MSLEVDLHSVNGGNTVCCSGDIPTGRNPDKAANNVEEFRGAGGGQEDRDRLCSTPRDEFQNEPRSHYTSGDRRSTTTKGETAQKIAARKIAFPVGLFRYRLATALHQSLHHLGKFCGLGAPYRPAP